MSRIRKHSWVRSSFGVLALWLAVSWSLPVMAAPETVKTGPDLTGKTVTAVSVADNANIPEDSIRKGIRLKPGDKLTAEAVRQDLQAIYEQGYFFDVAADFQAVPEGVKVTYRVRENPILKEIVIQGNTKVTTDKLRGMMTLRTGEVVNSKTLNEDMRKVETFYHDQGYVLSKVSDLSMGADGKLTISINEGTLEGIQVKGNTKTKTYVITREMKMKAGEPFNATAAKRSMQKVYNLGFFEDVNMKLKPGKEPNAVVVETDVVEQKTGTFSIGGGYSASDGLVGILELGDNNFRGTGDKVKMHWEFGGAGSDGQRNWEFGYTRPWLDKKETSLGVNFYQYTTEYNEYEGETLLSTYDRKRKGWDLTMGRPQGEFTRNYLTLKNRTDSYVAHVSGTYDYSSNAAYKTSNFGNTRSLIFAQTFDNRDNVFDPTSGRRNNLSVEVAGKFAGGDFNFNKFTYETRNYRKVGRSHVVAFRGTVGYASGSMPESQLFSAGGADTLRGYYDEAYKGHKMLAATLEYRFPVAQKVSGVVFTDVGNAWGGTKWDGTTFVFDGMKTSVGVGVRVNTPLGPIRLDYGVGSQGGRSHFSFGGQF